MFSPKRKTELFASAPKSKADYSEDPELVPDSMHDEWIDYVGTQEYFQRWKEFPILVSSNCRRSLQ